MRGKLWMLLVGALLAVSYAAATAQEEDARTLLQTSLRAMGGENLKSITYSGTQGYVATPGQNYSPSSDWPANQIVSYTRTIDYDARSSKLDYTLRQEPVRAALPAAATARPSHIRLPASSA